MKDIGGFMSYTIIEDCIFAKCYYNSDFFKGAWSENKLYVVWYKTYLHMNYTSSSSKGLAYFQSSTDFPFLTLRPLSQLVSVLYSNIAASHFPLPGKISLLKLSMERCQL